MCCIVNSAERVQAGDASFDFRDEDLRRIVCAPSNRPGDAEAEAPESLDGAPGFSKNILRSAAGLYARPGRVAARLARCWVP